MLFSNKLFPVGVINIDSSYQGGEARHGDGQFVGVEEVVEEAMDEIADEGEGELAKWGDDVAVHYVLRNLQGEQIESSYEYGEPMVFKIGSGEMIPAIEEAVMTLSQGAKVTVLTPSSQAFGEFDLGEMLPPYSPLLIDLELVEIK